MFRHFHLVLIPLLLLAAGCTRDPQAKSRELVENGNKFFTKGKFKEASIMYRRALAKDQKNADAYYRLGLTSVKLGDPPGAASAFRRAIDENKGNVDAITKLGDIYWMAFAYQPVARNKGLLTELDELSRLLLARDAKSFDALRFGAYLAIGNKMLSNIPNEKKAFDAEALKKLGEANTVKPYDPDLSILRAQLLYADGQKQEAEQLAKAVVEKHKNFPTMYDFLVELYLSENRVGDAEAVLKKKIENNPKQENHRLQLALFYARFFNGQRQADVEKALQGILDNKTDFPFGHLRVGEFALRFLRDPDRARREFEAGIAEGADKKPIYQRAMVDLLAMQGKGPEAQSLAEEILKNDPKDSVALAQKSALSLQSRDPQQIQAAVNDLQGLVTKSPTNHVYRFQLARAYMAKNQIDQARTHLEETLRLRPNMVAPKLLLAEVHSRRGEFPRVLQLADEVIAATPPANPTHLQARLLRSAALLGVKDVKRSKSELEMILKAAPNQTDALFQLALITLAEQNHKEAAKLFNQMNQINPNDSRGTIGMIETEVKQGNFAGAIQQAEAAANKDPNRLDMKVLLGNVLARAGRYDDAIRIFGDLSKRDPKSAELALKLGELHRFKGDVNTAVDEYKRAMSLEPNNPVPVMRIALLYEGVGRRDEAKPMYEQILRMDPSNLVALNNLAYIKAEEGTDLDQALAYAQRAKQRAPQDANISDTLGWVYIKKNLSEDAVRVFEELVKKHPSHPTYRYHLAMALFQKGDRQNAKKHAEQAMQSNPNKQEQGQIKELLGRIG
jgi:tetratricopeptide (TPR) repeat protein